MKVLNIVTLLLVIVGGLNWGLVGLFQFDLVAAIFGAGSALSRIVYVLVGLSALWQLGPLMSAFRGEAAPSTRTAERQDAGRPLRPASNVRSTVAPQRSARMIGAPCSAASTRPSPAARTARPTTTTGSRSARPRSPSPSGRRPG